MNKKIFVSFFLSAVLVFGLFAFAAPARAEASTLWGAAKEQLGANASTFSIISLVKSWAAKFSIAIPEWGIAGTYNSRTLNAAFLRNVTSAGSASAAPVGGGVPGNVYTSTSPSSLYQGENANVNWNATDIVSGSCVAASSPANPTFSGPIADSGNQQVTVNQSSTWIVTCTGLDGVLVRRESTIAAYNRETNSAEVLGSVTQLSPITVNTNESTNFDYSVSSLPGLSLAETACNIDFGNGTNSGTIYYVMGQDLFIANEPGATVSSNGLGGLNFSVPHTYTQPGTYTAHVVCSDVLGTVTSDTTITVVGAGADTQVPTIANTAPGACVSGLNPTDVWAASAVLATSTPTCNFGTSNSTITLAGNLDDNVGVASFTIDAVTPNNPTPTRIYNLTVPSPAPMFASFSVDYNFSVAGNYTFIETVMDANGNTAALQKIVTYQPATACSQQTVTGLQLLAAATVGQPYGPVNLTPGFSQPWMSYTLSSGTLPAGISLVPYPGGLNIAGTPTQAGFFPFTVKLEIDNNVLGAAANLAISSGSNCTDYYFSYNLTVIPGSTGPLSIENHVTEQPSGVELSGSCSPVSSDGPLSSLKGKQAASTILARVLAPANENCNYGSTSSSTIHILSIPHTTNFPIASETITLISTPVGSASDILCTFSAIFDTAVLALGGDSCQTDYTFANGAGLYTIRETVTDTSGATYIVDKFVNYQVSGPRPMVVSQLTSTPNSVSSIPVDSSNTYSFETNVFQETAGGPYSNLACTIDWGDSSPISNATLIQVFPSNAASVNLAVLGGGYLGGTADHVYTALGTYTAHVVCNDDIATEQQNLTTHGESYTTIIVTGPADTVAPTISNTMKINGVTTAGNCSTSGMNTTCDFGTLYTSNLDWSGSFNDDSGSLAGLRADLFRPIPLSAVNLAFGAGISDLPHVASANLSAYMTTTGSYRLVESAADGASNSVNFSKTWNFVNDVDNPTIVNNNYTGPVTVQNANYNVSGVVTDPGFESQTVAIHQDAASVVCGPNTSAFDSVLSNVTTLTATVTPPSFSGPALVPQTSNCFQVSWNSNSGSGTLDYDSPVSFSFTQGVTQIGPQTFTTPVYKIVISISGNTVHMEFFGQNGNSITSSDTFCGIIAANAQFAFSGPAPCLTGTLNFPAPSSSGIDYVTATLNGNAVSSTNLVLSDPSHGTFAFSVTLAEGLNTINETVCDKAGHCANFTKQITLITDTDHDGVLDPNDQCVTVPGTAQFHGCPSGLNVSVEEVDASAKPALQTDTALQTKVFSSAAGSCAANIGNQIKNYDKIYNTCIAEATAKETFSPSGSDNKPRNFITDLAGIYITTGDKLVLVQSRVNPDGSHGYMGFDLPAMKSGESRNVGFNRTPGQDLKGLFVQDSIFSRNSKGIWNGSNRAQVIKGSELYVFKPDLVTWSDGQEIYPFTFISDSDWELDVCLQVPVGYTIVAPGTCDQTLISNEAKVVEFQVAATGSGAAAAFLAQATTEPSFTMNLTTKHKEAGSTVVKETNTSYQVSGLSSASRRANDLALAPIVAAEKAKADAVLAQATQAAQGQAVSAIAITFKLTLSAGTQSADVLRLQQYLNNHGFTVSASGPGSKGNETTYFGPKTKAALIAFQEAHRAEILTNLGLIHGTGILGPSTRAYINAHQ
jgi:hypothetical protein